MSSTSQNFAVKIYVSLLLIMLACVVFLALFSDFSRYMNTWIPSAIGNLFDVIKLLVGAVIGALTPAAIGAVGSASDTLGHRTERRHSGKARQSAQQSPLRQDFLAGDKADPN